MQSDTQMIAEKIESDDTFFGVVTTGMMFKAICFCTYSVVAYFTQSGAWVMQFFKNSILKLLSSFY